MLVYTVTQNSIKDHQVHQIISPSDLLLANKLVFVFTANNCVNRK